MHQSRTGGGAAAGGAAEADTGAGQSVSPLCVIIDRRTTSSSRLMLYRPPSPMERRNCPFSPEQKVDRSPW